MLFLILKIIFAVILVLIGFMTYVIVGIKMQEQANEEREKKKR